MEAAASICARASMSLPSAQARGRIAMDEPHALERDAVGERMETRRAERLEAMDEGIDAGGRGHRARQSDGQFRRRR